MQAWLFHKSLFDRAKICSKWCRRHDVAYFASAANGHQNDPKCLWSMEKFQYHYYAGFNFSLIDFFKDQNEIEYVVIVIL